MKSALTSQSSSFLSNNNRLKKKSTYSKKVINSILQLKTLLNEKQTYEKLSLFLEKKIDRVSPAMTNLKKKGSIVLYSICFSFSAVNTFLYVTDALGTLKFRYSAGLLNFKGKLKKSRFQILKLFFKELRKLKITVLKNKPISLHLKNVGSYRYLIVRNLKKLFFVRLIKNYQTHPYNGCRKKKKLRK
jgi:ribosomal protein S11